MKPPIEYENVEDVRPLVCVWDALHPDGSHEALFDVEVADAHFPRVWFFSMSNYLRSLDSSEIEIDMPAASARMDWLKKLFPNL